MSGRDLLVRNFWRYLLSQLALVNVTMTDEGGAARTIRWNDISCASAEVKFGTSTAAPAWDDYALKAPYTAAEGAALTPSLTVGADRMLITFGRGVAAAGVREVGLRQGLVDTGGTVRSIYLARAVLDSAPPAGSTVLYRLAIYPPWVKNFALMWFGLLRDANQDGAVDVTGATYTMRTNLIVLAAPPYLQVGVGTREFSFDDYALTTPLTLSSSLYYENTDTYVLIAITGVARLTADMTITELGMVQKLYDSGGATRDTLLLRYVLPSPVEKKAGDVVTASVTIYASA